MYLKLAKIATGYWILKDLMTIDLIHIWKCDKNILQIHILVA